MIAHPEAMELCQSISRSMGRLSGVVEQLYHHAAGEDLTEVADRRAASMEVMREMERAVVALVGLAEAATPQPGKPH